MPDKDKSDADLLSFFYADQTRKEAATAPSGKVLGFILERGGRVSRSELYEWALDNGLKPAELYAALKDLLDKKAVERRFDDTINEIVFIARVEPK